MTSDLYFAMSRYCGCVLALKFPKDDSCALLICVPCRSPRMLNLYSPGLTGTRGHSQFIFSDVLPGL